MFQHRSFKYRIFACLVPLAISMVGASLFLVYQNSRTMLQTQELQKSVSFFGALSQSIHELQKERGKSVLYLGSKLSRADLDGQREALNKKLVTAKGQASRLDSNTQNAMQTIQDELTKARAFVDTQGPAPESALRLSEVIKKMIALQVARAKAFPYEGLEGRLVSQGIFEMAKENMGRLRAGINGVLASDSAVDDSTLSGLERFRAGITANLESPSLLVSEKTISAAHALLESSKWREVQRVLSKIHEKRLTGQFGEDSKAVFDHFTSLMDEVFALVDAETSDILAATTKAYEQAVLSFWSTLLASSLILMGVIGMASKTVREIAGSLDSLSVDVSRGAQLTSSSAQDLAAASDSLSTGVTEQAASLQETVSSLQEVSAMIKMNSEHAEGLKSAASIGVKSAEECDTEVHGMLEAISHIRSSSDAINQQIETNNQNLNKITSVIAQIADKTKVINDIVFQTKLLSFNASVEAARAGEHGKGFAVVAEEIGNLAAMSGRAALEISTLLQSGVDQVNSVISESREKIGALTGKSKEDVEAGAERAQGCQGALQSALGKIREISEMANAIARASAEQAQGASEISIAMNELDQVTQSNSGSAAKVAGVAGRLNEQAHHLASSVQELNQIVHGGLADVQRKRVQDSAWTEAQALQHKAA